MLFRYRQNVMLSCITKAVDALHSKRLFLGEALDRRFGQALAHALVKSDCDLFPLFANAAAACDDDTLQ